MKVKISLKGLVIDDQKEVYMNTPEIANSLIKANKKINKVQGV